MDPLLDAVASAIRKRGLIGPGARVCVALSGGPDSTALLHLLLELSDDIGFRVNACHFDHALRPESADDAVFVERAVEELGAPFVSERDPAPPTRSIQSEARGRRYGFFERLIASGYAELVATGHTLDDSVETSIMWMLRGTGPGAFGGVPWKRGSFVRPLLGVRKHDLVRWLEQRGVAFLSDPSNLTGRYLRNRIRQRIIPAMEREAPGAVEAIARLAELTREQSALLETAAAGLLESITMRRRPGRVTMSLAAVHEQPDAMRGLVYRAALDSAGHDPSALTLRHIEAIDRLVTTGSLGRSVDLPGGLVARADHAGLSLGARPDTSPVADIPFGYPLECAYGEGTLTVRAVEGGRAANHVADAGRMPDDAVFRSRRPGDFLRLPNMKGRKKLKTFLIDRKVPSGVRATMPLLASGSEILWVPGRFLARSVTAGERVGRAVELSWD